MRNLMEYPVTVDECLEVINTLKFEILRENQIGDIRPLVLTYVYDFILENLDRFKEAGCVNMEYPIMNFWITSLIGKAQSS